MISEAEAWDIARVFANELSATVGRSLHAVVVIGSLGGGTYRPGRSDIDLAVVLNDSTAHDADAAIESLAASFRVRHSIPKDLGVVILRQRQLLRPYTPESEIVPEVIRLKQQGVVVHGTLDLEAIPIPTQEEIRTSEKVFFTWLREHYVSTRPEAERTVDAIINTILLELRLFIWNATGEYILDKPAMVGRFLSLPGCQSWATTLDPVDNYVKGGHPACDLTALESTLRLISRFVQDQVRW